MKLNGVRIYLILSILIIMSIKVSFAHGVIYETQKLSGNNIRITLKWDEKNNNGLKISYFYLQNGKTLNIGYEVTDKETVNPHIDFDTTKFLNPIRIVLNRIDDNTYSVFRDIEGIEAEEYIRHLHDSGIVNGRDGQWFDPDATITRAEFMVLMVKALKLEQSNITQTNTYADIKNHWAEKTIITAANSGLISGYADGTIRPNNPITLAEVSTVITRAFSFKTRRNGIYTKLDKNTWHYQYMKKMLDIEIIKSTDNIYISFNPSRNITRRDCAMMISRALSTY